MGTTQAVSSQGYCSCFDRINYKDWDPRKTLSTPEKVAKFAAYVLAVCIITMVVSGLMINHPGVTSAFFTILSLTALASIVALAISLNQTCRKQDTSMAAGEKLKATMDAAKEELIQVHDRIVNKAD